MTSSVSLAVMFPGEMSTTGGSAIRKGRKENQSTLSNLEEERESEGVGLIDEEIPSTLSQCVGRMTMTALSVTPHLSTGSIARWRSLSVPLHATAAVLANALGQSCPKITMLKVGEALSIRRNEESVPKVRLI